MPRIPLFAPPNTSDEAIGLSSQAERVVDGFFDSTGALRKRPGLEEFCDLSSSSGIVGLYYWVENDELLAVSNQTLYSISSTGVATQKTAQIFSFSGMCSFAPVKPGGTQKIVIANGVQMYLYDGSTATAISDADAPQAVTHVDFVDQYILANSTESGDESRFFWSNVNDPTTWDAVDLSDVEGRPDNLTVLKVGWREVFLGGPRSIEFFYNDGVSPFARINGASVNDGVGAPQTVQFFNNTWCYLNTKRQFVMLNGRVPQQISQQIDRSIQDLTTISDAVAFITEAGGRSFYVATFPTENKTFAYDFTSGYWAEWGNWNIAMQRYDRHKGLTSAYDHVRNKWFIGDYGTGKIFTSSLTDYDDGGDPIRTMIQTPWIDFNTDVRKRSDKLTFRIKAGMGKDGGNSASGFSVKYRDTNEGQFGNARTISMGAGGDHFFYRELRRNGIYRARQYQIIHSDSAEFSILKAEEEAILLGS